MHRRPWILIVEDEALLARLLYRRLQQIGAPDTEVCATGASALLTVTRRGPPAAIVLDGSLAGTERGADVLVALRDAGVSAPCAFWTSAPEDVRDALARRGLDAEAPIFVKQDIEGVLEWALGALPDT